MQRINLSRFYHFGASLGQLKAMEPLDKMDEQHRHFIYATVGLETFLIESADMRFPLSRKEADMLLFVVRGVISKWTEQRVFDPDDLSKIKQMIGTFETVFGREASRVSAYSITPKGIYDTEKLIDEGEKKFPPELLAVMPAAVIEDIRESSRCMAFERGTASAFHICRATEGLMRAYYKHLTGYNWPPPPAKAKVRKDWAGLVEQLGLEGAPKKIIERLGELRADRNSYAHPDTTVPVDEAPVVYETCTFVMFYIAKEMVGDWNE